MTTVAVRNNSEHAVGGLRLSGRGIQLAQVGRDPLRPRNVLFSDVFGIGQPVVWLGNGAVLGDPERVGRSSDANAAVAYGMGAAEHYICCFT